MAELQVIKPGWLTTVQDLGRWGFQSSGVSVAGPMDAYSHRLANALVGNRVSDATLEVTLVGPELVCDDDRGVAVTGAELELAIDDRPVAMNTELRLTRGSRLSCGPRRGGARAYVAIEGGIAVPPVLGSRATHLTSAMGGLDGRALRRGDRLPLGQPRERRWRSVRLHADAIVVNPLSDLTIVAPKAGGGVAEPEASGRYARVRVLLGPHVERFDPAAVDLLQAAPYVVGPESNRMGFRLDGAPLAVVRRSAMISDVTPMGSLQVPSSGLPILLMADRQTVGGYPIIATVIAADLGIAGQLIPGDSIAFAVCSRAEALGALIAREQRLMSLEYAGPASADELDA